MDDERVRVLTELRTAHVPGADGFGRFVNDTQHFAPSSFDERAAMPVLLTLLPSLQDSRNVTAVAGHLRRAWARPEAYEPVRDAFRLWAPQDPMGAGWALGDTLGTVATSQHAQELLALARVEAYREARQMLIASLWRHKTVADVEPVLIELLEDDTVARHALGALRRVIGKAEMRPHFERLAARSPGTPLGRQAASRLRKWQESRRTDKP